MCIRDRLRFLRRHDVFGEIVAAEQLLLQILYISRLVEIVHFLAELLDRVAGVACRMGVVHALSLIHIWDEAGSARLKRRKSSRWAYPAWAGRLQRNRLFFLQIIHLCAYILLLAA